MKNGVLVVCALALSIGMAAPASAQTCMGFSPIAKATPFQAGAGYGHSSGRNSIFGTFAAGTDQFFVDASIGHNSYPGFGSGTFGADFGGQLNLDKMDRKFSICPAFTFQTEWGNALAGTVFFYGGAVAAGTSIKGSGKMMFIPTAMLQYGQSRQSGAGDTYGILTFGVGLQFDPRMTLRPALTQTFGLFGPESTGFLLNFTYAFGAKQ